MDEVDRVGDPAGAVGEQGPGRQGTAGGDGGAIGVRRETGAQIDRAEGKFTWDELASQYRVQNKPCANKRIGQT